MLAAWTMAFLWVALGMACGWWLCLSARDIETSAAWTVSTAALATGLLISLLYSWILLELGWFRPAFLMSGLIIIGVVGAAIGWRFHRRALLNTARKTMAPALLFMLSTLLLSAYAPRSEWMVGGWDPGVYMNQGIHAARHAGWEAEPMPVHAELAEQDFNPFVRPIAGRDELFPGIPMNPNSGAIRPTFYPLTPTWIALLYIMGGLDAAFLSMPLLALLLLFILPGGLLRAGASPALACGATMLVLLQPLILYHARTPCSEMMETLFVCMLLFAFPRDEEQIPVTFCSMILLAGVVNRPTFLIWIALLFPIWAGTRRLHPLRGITLSIPVLLGIAYYLTRGQAALDRITNVFPLLAGASIASVYLSCITTSLRRRVTWKLFPALLFLSAPLLVLLVTAHVHPHPWPELITNVSRLLPYVGWPLILLSGVGILLRLLAIGRNGRMEGLDGWLLLCLCATVVPLVFKFAADLYPWATKRYLSSIPLATALGAAIALAATAAAARGRWPHWSVAPWMVGILIVGIGHGARLPHAWFHTEYDGVSVVLEDVAEAIHPEDIVLADHFLWATPLTLIHQRQVLNGERLWARETDTRTEAALAFLRERQERGQRVLMLTSTDRGADVFPAPFEAAALLHAFVPHTYSVIVHHRNGTGFPLRKRTTPFRLYVLSAPP